MGKIGIKLITNRTSHEIDKNAKFSLPIALNNSVNSKSADEKIRIVLVTKVEMLSYAKISLKFIKRAMKQRGIRITAILK